MSAKQSLGRGFEALIPKDVDVSILAEDPSRVQKLLIAEIVPNNDQPRQQWDSESLNELAGSIKTHGILQPIIVVKLKNGYRIVAGERRWRAAQLAGLSNIPAVVRTFKELEEVEIALIENIQRVDLSPLEQALAVLKLQQQFSLTLEEISKKLSKAPSTISNISRLLQLPQDAQEALRANKISEGHARAILALRAQPDKQIELLRCILNNNWTVRQAEQFAIQAKKGQKPNQKSDSNSNDKVLTSELSQVLSAKVSISRKSQGGRLSVDFDNDEQLMNLVKKLNK